MKLIFNGHTYKYETESLCKLFFSCVRFEIEYDTRAGVSEDNYIFTRVAKGKKCTVCYAVVHAGGEVSKKALSLLNDAENYDKECELVLCKALYCALEKLTGISPAWGVLTGIRPVKRIQSYMADGMSDEQIADHLKNRYLVSDSKIQLGLNTAKTQNPILNTADNFSYSLYVAIPFCPSRCSYCSFISQSAADKRIHSQIPEYLTYLHRELEATARLAKQLGLSLKTVYIGGGTPTVLTAEQLTELTKVIDKQFDFSDVSEYTIEAGRPDSITEDKLRAIQAAGVTRISINPQTLNNEVLTEIGRKHTAQDFIGCFDMARRLGFKNINTDFIAGLPKDTADSFKYSIDRAVELSPENITVHTLSYKKAARMYTDSPLKTLQNDPTGEMVDYARARLTGNGYNPYYLYRQKNTLQNLENVGYARPGYECLYNVYIMEETHTILACGASASTKLVNIDSGYIERVFNYKYPFEYNKNFEEMLRRKEEVVRFYDEQFKKKYDIGEINRRAERDPAVFVAECERAYRERVDLVADYIKMHGHKVVFLAGPTASGKTTTAENLHKGLSIRGIRAATISLDDFLLDYEQLPRFPDGTVDYDSIDTLDVDCFKRCITELIETNATDIPQFDFVKRGRNGSKELRIDKEHIVIVEGIHALNTKITESKYDGDFLKLYISPKSEYYADGKRVLNSRDVRFIRRLIRDSKFRASDANNTIDMWTQVCKSEQLYIRPFRKTADFWIDSSHLYEPLIYKPFLLTVLSAVEQGSKYYDESERLSAIIRRFAELNPDFVPNDSMIREFIGN